MSVTVRQFKADFPEFEATADNVVQSRLSMASRQVNSVVWGEKADDGIKLLAAHMLAMAPRGEQARLKAENRNTIYGEQYETLVHQVAFGYRVI